MNIVVFGVGGVGGYFGGKLCMLASKKADINVYFIARGDHLREIQFHGLELDSDEGKFICKPKLTTDNVELLPLIDLLLVCTKGFDLNNAIKSIESKICESTIILPLLNGIDIPERILTATKKGIIIPACVYVGTHIDRPGVIKQRGGACTIHWGKGSLSQNDFQKLKKLLTESDIKNVDHENPQIEIWKKYIFISSFGMVTAANSKTIGEVMESEELSLQVKSIMNEVFEISQKKQIGLSQEIVEESFNRGKSFPYETKTSFQRDYENEYKKDERDLFGGTITRLAELFGVEASVSKKVYAALIEKNC